MSLLHPTVLNLAGVASGGGDAADWARLGAGFDAAMRTHGIVYLTGTGVPASLISSLRSQALAFFGQPLAAKQSFSLSAMYGGPGYSGLGREVVARSHSAAAAPVRDTVESLMLFSPDPPACPPALQTSVADYTAHMSRVLTLVLRLADAGLNANLSAQFAAPRSALRLAYYPPAAAAAAGEWGYGPHTDFSGFTLLAQDAAPRFPAAGALEVRDGDEWRPVQPVEDAILVNPGDLIERWTNGRYRSPLHRVRLAQGRKEPRISLVFFSGPADDAVVKPLKQCCGEGCPPRFEPVVAGEWLREKIRLNAVEPTEDA